MKTIIIAVLVSLITALVVVNFAGGGPAQKDQETAYERVMRTNELRCGYFAWNPALMVDPNARKLSGIFYDVMEAMGNNLRVKIVWVEEIGLGDYVGALDSGRIDAMCSGIYAHSERSRVNDFTTPAYYSPLHFYVRVNDHRFDGMTVEQLNNPDFRVAIIEGGVTSALQRHYLPQAQVFELPQNISPAELFVSLAANKADFVIYDLFTFEDYNAHNPGQLRRLTKEPLKTFPVAVAIDKNQDALREMLSTAMMDLHLSGVTDKIIGKYEIYEGSFLRLAAPYKQSE